jgi:hypothetical protein
MTELAVGEKYLRISVLGQIKLAAFKNQKKSKPSDPDFIGNGVTVWINTKKEPKEQRQDLGGL